MRDTVRHGDADAVRRLVRAGEDPNSVLEASGWSALMLAVEYLDFDVVQELLACGADPQFALHDGWSILHQAVDSAGDGQNQTGIAADGRIVKLLVNAGADPHAVRTDRSGSRETPREMAARYRNPAILRALDG